MEFLTATTIFLASLNVYGLHTMQKPQRMELSQPRLCTVSRYVESICLRL